MPDSSIEFKELHTPSEFKELSSVFDITFSKEKSTEKIDFPSTNSARYVLGVIYHGEIIGGLVAFELSLIGGKKEFYLYDIGVLPQFQKQGIGTRLVSVLKEEATRRGVATIFVEAEADDIGAIAFYRSLDAEEVLVNHFNINL